MLAARAAAMHGEGRWRKRWEVGPVVVAACELPQSARGFERGCAAAAMVVGSAYVPLSGIGRSEREREGGRERAGDVNATMHDKLKRGSWDGYNMDKSWKEIIELR
jgi:hypothetical protein